MTSCNIVVVTRCFCYDKKKTPELSQRFLVHTKEGQYVETLLTSSKEAISTLIVYEKKFSSRTMKTLEIDSMLELKTLYWTMKKLL